MKVRRSAVWQATFWVRPSRSEGQLDLMPAGPCAHSLRQRSPRSSISWPFSAVTTSPSASPARAAGPPGATPVTTTPVGGVGGVEAEPGPRRLVDPAEAQRGRPGSAAAGRSARPCCRPGSGPRSPPPGPAASRCRSAAVRADAGGTAPVRMGRGGEQRGRRGSIPSSRRTGRRATSRALRASRRPRPPATTSGLPGLAARRCCPAAAPARRARPSAWTRPEAGGLVVGHDVARRRGAVARWSPRPARPR